MAFLLGAIPVPLSAQSAMVSTVGGGHSTIMLTVPLGQTAMFNGVAVRPLRVVEDSRCPIDATCVWRGRLRVQAALGAGPRGRTIILEDGKPVAMAGGRLTLVGASPPRRTSTAPGRYSFNLRFER